MDRAGPFARRAMVAGTLVALLLAGEVCLERSQARPAGFVLHAHGWGVSIVAGWSPARGEP